MLLIFPVTTHFVKQLADTFAQQKPILVSAHAVEGAGVNAIPEALADMLAQLLGWPTDNGIVQINIVAHTGADGFSRLARQAKFDGDAKAGKPYLLTDDFVGQGGTLANLRAHIMSRGGNVVGATVLTGKPHSAKMTLDVATYKQLRLKHGEGLEDWWNQRFGF